MQVKACNNWEVLTPFGWRDFSGTSKSSVPVHVKLTFKTGKYLNCSPTHKIKTLTGGFVDAIDIQVGDIILDTPVVGVELIEDELDVYDLRGVVGEEYYTDGIISHNCAFIEDAAEIWTSAQATLSTGGKAILISTPNGVGNFFHKKWLEAESGQSNFNAIMLNWRVHPDRDQAWRDRQTEILGEMQAAQEHDASFIFSGNNVISAEILEFYRNTFVQEPLSKQGFDGNLWIWEYPMDGRTYILCADVARGDGEDFSTFHVLDAENSVQVAEYKGKIPTKEFGDLMVMAATMYNDALLIPDNSSIGWNAVQRIIDRGYKNLFYMSADMQYVDVEQQITDRRYISEKNMKPGFIVSSRTRPLIIAKLDEYMREKAIIIKSARMITELETFIWKNGRAEALQGYNDDLTFAMGVGLWVRDTALRLRQEGIELTKLSLDKASYATMPFALNPTRDYNPYQMPLGETQHEDIRWLLG